MIKKASWVLLGAGLVFALGFAAPTPLQAEPYGRYSRRPSPRQEIRQDWREVQNSRAELRRDVQEYYQDLDALRRARRQDASPAEIARLRSEVREGAREIVQDRRELREDYTELRRDFDRYSSYNYGYFGNRGWWGWNNWWGWRNDRWDHRERWDYRWD